MGTNLIGCNGTASRAASSLARRFLNLKGMLLIDLSVIEVVIVPALRIDRSGYRLGQGGGYLRQSTSHT
jgi:5-formyltetrahydrofolate cyclo-ligase